jgi:hypothetical protein
VLHSKAELKASLLAGPDVLEGITPHLAQILEIPMNGSVLAFNAFIRRAREKARQNQETARLKAIEDAAGMWHTDPTIHSPRAVAAQPTLRILQQGLLMSCHQHAMLMSPANPEHFSNEHLVGLMQALRIEFDQATFTASRLHSQLLSELPFSVDASAFGMTPTALFALRVELARMKAAFEISGLTFCLVVIALMRTVMSDGVLVTNALPSEIPAASALPGLLLAFLLSVYIWAASLVAFTLEHVCQYAERAGLSKLVIEQLRDACVTGKAIVNGFAYYGVVLMSSHPHQASAMKIWSRLASGLVSLGSECWRCLRS